jgi:hypothetical protein
MDGEGAERSAPFFLAIFSIIALGERAVAFGAFL